MIVRMRFSCIRRIMLFEEGGGGGAGWRCGWMGGDIPVSVILGYLMICA
jgi:hypothetical protein